MEAVRLAANRTFEAGEVVGRAYADDPLLAYIVPDRSARTRQGLAAAGVAVVRYGLRFGTVEVVGTPIDGVAISLAPAPSFASPVRWAAAVQAAFGLGVPLVGLARLSRIAFDTGRSARRAVSPPHHRLLLLAVNPAQRRQGIGTMLLQSALQRADAQGIPCATATGHAHAVLFLRKHGFEVVADDGLPGGGPRIWTLVRSPRR